MEHVVDEKVIIAKLYSIFKEAKNGRVTIDTTDDMPFTFNVAFQVESNIPEIHTVQEDSTLPILEINNLKLFIKTIHEQAEYYMDFYKSKYPELTEENLAKMVMVSFFFNMTYEDFQNPISYLKELPHTHPINAEYSFEFEDAKFSAKIIHEINQLNLETIDRLEIILDTKDVSILLPHVNYSISKDKAYIKCIQSTYANNPYQPIIAQLLPKVSGTANSFMRNINPLHLLSLTIAIKAISDQTDVKEFVFPTFMPVRYLGAIETLMRKTKLEAKKNNIVIEDEEQLREEMTDRYNSIQTNITNKFVNTINRFTHHINNYSVLNYDDYASYLSIAQTRDECTGNNFLTNIMKTRERGKNRKK